MLSWKRFELGWLLNSHRLHLVGWIIFVVQPFDGFCFSFSWPIESLLVECQGEVHSPRKNETKESSEKMEWCHGWRNKKRQGSKQLQLHGCMSAVENIPPSPQKKAAVAFRAAWGFPWFPKTVCKLANLYLQLLGEQMLAFVIVYTLCNSMNLCE